MWMTLLVCTLVLIVLWISFPLFTKKEAWATQQQLAAIDQNLEQREHLMRLLKDLEVEFESGGIEEEEYLKLQKGYLTEAALVARNLSALQAQ